MQRVSAYSKGLQIKPNKSAPEWCRQFPQSVGDEPHGRPLPRPTASLDHPHAVETGESRLPRLADNCGRLSAVRFTQWVHWSVTRT